MATIMEMDPEEFFRRFNESQRTDTTTVRRYDPSRGVNLDDKEDRGKFLKGVREYTKGMKEATSVTRSLANVFEGVREEMNFDEAAANLEAMSANMDKFSDSAEKAALKEQQAELMKAVAFKTAVTTAANFAGSMLKASNTLLEANRAFELALLNGASGIEAGTQNLIASIEAQKQMADAQADVIKDVSAGLGALAMSFGPWGRIIGAAIALLGPLVASFLKFENDQTAKAAQHRAKVLGQELKKTEDTYRQITQSGAMFAGGMGEMRAQAAAAGMMVKDFGNLIKNSTLNLANMGMGVAQAAQRIGGVSKVLRTTELGTQLRNLGLNTEEQAEAAAATASALNASGRLRTMSDAQVAQTTVAYSKDLKILQGITGEDAKKKMEEAKKRTMEADLLAQAMAKGGPEAMEKLRNQLATMPETMKKGYMEFVSTGGSAIADAATNVAISQNPKIMEQYQQMFSLLGDGSKDASSALTQTAELTAATAEYARQHADSVKEMATAGRLGASELGQATIDIHNSLILANQQFTKGVAEATQKNVDELSKTQDPITNAINRLAEETNTAAVQLETGLTPQLAAAADAIPRFTGAMAGAIDALNALTGNKKAGPAETVGGYAAGAAGAYALGSMGAAMGTAIAPGIGTAVGAAVGGAVGGAMGYFTGTWLGKQADEASAEAKKNPDKKSKDWYNPASWFAKGGIASGPNSGFPAMLHGTEAVVPLPDGKTLPVSLNLGSMGAEFAKSMQKDTAMDNAIQDPKIMSAYNDMLIKLDNGTRNMDQLVKTTASNNASAMSSAMDLIGKVVPAFGLADKLISTAKENPAVREATTMLGESFTKVSSTLSTAFAPQIDAFDSFTSKLKDIGRVTFEKLVAPPTTALATATDNKTNTDLTKNITDALVAKSTSNDSILSEVRDLIKSQLSKHDEMISHLKETADINQRLLNQSYS